VKPSIFCSQHQESIAEQVAAGLERLDDNQLALLARLFQVPVPAGFSSVQRSASQSSSPLQPAKALDQEHCPGKQQDPVVAVEQHSHATLRLEQLAFPEDSLPSKRNLFPWKYNRLIFRSLQKIFLAYVFYVLAFGDVPLVARAWIEMPLTVFQGFHCGWTVAVHNPWTCD